MAHYTKHKDSKSFQQNACFLLKTFFFCKVCGTNAHPNYFNQIAPTLNGMGWVRLIARHSPLARKRRMLRHLTPV